MLTRKGDSKRPSTSRAGVYEIGGSATAAAAYSHSVGGGAAASQMSLFAPSADHGATVSEFIARFDEAARQRLQRMNEKLMHLEMQMGQLEAEMMTKTNGVPAWA